MPLTPTDSTHLFLAVSLLRVSSQLVSRSAAANHKNLRVHEAGEGIAGKSSKKCEYMRRDVNVYRRLYMYRVISLGLVLSSGSSYQRYAFVVVIDSNHHHVAIKKKRKKLELEQQYSVLDLQTDSFKIKFSYRLKFFK